MTNDEVRMTKQIRMTNDERACDATGNAEVNGVDELLPFNERDRFVFRMGKKHLWIASLCTVGFLAIGVGSVMAAWWNVDGSFRHPHTAAIVFASFWSIWFALGIWLLLAYFRTRLVITADQIDKSGCLRTRSMFFDEVINARWRAYGRGGSLVLRSRDCRIAVHFDNFANDKQKEPRTIFRALLDDRVQESWENYESSIVHRVPADARKARRIRLFLAAVFLAHAFAFCALAVAGIGNQVQLLVTAVLNLVVGAWLMSKAHGTDSTNRGNPQAESGGVTLFRHSAFAIISPFWFLHSGLRV
jgi:hypothetical protein